MKKGREAVTMERVKERMTRRFRQWIRRLSALYACLLLLAACSKQIPSATDLMADLLAALEHPDMAIYFDSAPEEGEGWLSEEELSALYGGHSTAALADRYAIALCRDDRIYELHLYYARSATAASQIEELLRGRLEELQKRENYLYDPDSLAASGIVWKNGNRVCLLVTEDNAKAKEIIKDRI